MTPRFRPGAMAYAKDGRSYIVDEVDDGIVYCSSPSGAETEFPEAHLLNEAEWAARSDGRRDTIYARLKQAPAYTVSKVKLDPLASEQLLSKVERLSPGMLDFVAVTIAARFLAESGEQDAVSGLSTAKCREIFDATPFGIRAGLLANILGTQPDALVGAGRLGDNLMRALLDKGIAANAAAFASFRLRR
jgi:hypothetical protein